MLTNNFENQRRIRNIDLTDAIVDKIFTSIKNQLNEMPLEKNENAYLKLIGNERKSISTTYKKCQFVCKFEKVYTFDNYGYFKDLEMIELAENDREYRIYNTTIQERMYIALTLVERLIRVERLNMYWELSDNDNPLFIEDLNQIPIDLFDDLSEGGELVLPLIKIQSMYVKQLKIDNKKANIRDQMRYKLYELKNLIKYKNYKCISNIKFKFEKSNDDYATYDFYEKKNCLR